MDPTREYRIRLVTDPDPESPRDWDNHGLMVCWHRRYLLGDEQPGDLPTDYRQRYMRDAVVLPLFLLDHSGITMRTTPFGDQWDSGQVGWIYVPRQQLRENQLSDEDGEQILKGEVEVYDQFLRGDIYGYVVESRPREVFDIHGERLDVEVAWEEEDSCWGFYGTDPFKNGMSEYIDDDLHGHLREAEIDS